MGTVGKALDLLELFTPARPQLGLGQLARLSGISTATCHRLLGGLHARGLVDQHGPAREYRIGPAVLRLAVLRLAALREAAVPLIAAAPAPVALRSRIALTQERGSAETVSTFEKDVHSSDKAAPPKAQRGQVQPRACEAGAMVRGIGPRITGADAATILSALDAGLGALA